jgi:hypothetical protein
MSMPVLRPCALALVVLCVAGCAVSQVPHPKTFPSTSQLNPKASEHWQTMADDIALQTRASIEARADLKGQPVYVVPAAKPTPFGTAFHNFIVTRLVHHGVPVSTGPEGPLVLDYQSQLVRHGSERLVYHPGTLTVLTGGLLVARNIAEHGLSPLGFAALGIGADIAASTLDGAIASKLELNVTTSVVANGRYVMRKSDIYYLDEADAALFIEPRSVPTREYKVIGASR